MMRVCRETVSTFDKYIGDYWIDSGTLLGIIREDRFLPWEHDIDMATWSDAINNAVRRDVLNEMHDRGFRGYFKRDKATFSKDGVKIDIWFLDKVGSMATRTRAIPTSRLSKMLFMLSLIFGALPNNMALCVYRILHWAIQRLGCDRIKIGIPRKYLSSIVAYSFKGIEIKIPENVEEYLEFRYGDDWRVPNTSWDTWTQDGMIR